MKTHKWKDIEERKLTPAQRAEAEKWAQAEVERLQLRELREMAGLTQVEAARRLESTQGTLSEMEKRTDHKVSTLRKYVEALGGELEVTAWFGDRALRLKI